MPLDTPKIQCHSAVVPVLEKNAVLRCDVYFKPELTALFWILDGNGTTLAVGDFVDDYWTLILVSSQI